jgi:cytochrome subunit of sulfide dehydrogenase
MPQASLHRLFSATALAAGCFLAAAAHAQSSTPADSAQTLGRNLAATCANCHGTNGAARGEMKPLAGLPAEAIVGLMSAYKAGSLPATIMHQVAKGYTDEQIKLIAAYLAAQPLKK